MKNFCFTLILCLTLLGFSSSSAQVYRTAAGVRFESGQIGFTLAQKVARKMTVEGILIENSQEQLMGHLLLKRHVGLFQRRLNAYGGAGLHTGLGITPTSLAGFSLVGGAEFTLFRITVAADLRPHWNWIETEFQGMTPSLAIRYSLVRDRDNRRRHKRSSQAWH